MLSKSIIVSSISNLSDARYCSGMGVAYLGVCTDRSNPSYLSIEKFREISGWLSGINWILEPPATDVNEILKNLEAYAVNSVYTSSFETAAILCSTGVNVILKVEKPFTNFDISGLAGIVLDLELIADLNSLTGEDQFGCPVYVVGNFSIDQLEEIRADEKIAGVMLSGGIEERPGFKNMDELIDSLEVFEE